MQVIAPSGLRMQGKRICTIQEEEGKRKGGMLLLLLSEKGNPRGALMSLPCLVLPASIWVLLAVPP